MDRREVVRHLKKFKKDLSCAIGESEIILFGSHARGDANEYSDIDLLIVSDGFIRINPLRRSAKIRPFWSIHSPVDMICLTRREFDSKKDGLNVISEARKEGVVI